MPWPVSPPRGKQHSTPTPPANPNLLATPVLLRCPGAPVVRVTEEGGKRYIESTGTFNGTELFLHAEVGHGPWVGPAMGGAPMGRCGGAATS